MLLGTIALWAAALGPPAGSQDGAGRTVVSERGDGCTVEREVREGPEGSLVDHGAYRVLSPDGVELEEGEHEGGRRSGRWMFRHRNGERAAVGAYRDGVRTGTWRTYHPSGERRSKGRYDDGWRDGRWDYWLPDGATDELRSGEYAVARPERPDGTPLGEGETVDGFKQGTWTYFWPGGAEQLRGPYLRGVPDGAWVFLHPDGTLDPLLLSGHYRAGDWTGPVVEAPPAPAADERPGPFPESPAFAVEEEHRALAERAFADDPGERERAARRLGELGRDAVPALLDVLRRLDLASEEGASRAAWMEESIFAPLFAGARYGLAGASTVAERILAAQRWCALWESCADDAVFWALDLPRRHRDPVAAARTLEPVHRAMFRPRPGEERRPALYGPRFAPPSRRERRSPARQALDAALEWLAAHQAPDGSWSAEAFGERCPRGEEPGSVCDGPGAELFDVGVTGLALLAFLGDGHTPVDGDHRDVVLRGLGWLLGQQQIGPRNVDWHGFLGPRRAREDIYNHAIATQALAEGLALCRSEGLRAAVRAAVDLIERARKPDGAWRYDVPSDGDEDSSITGWMVSALAAASSAGVDVTDAALAGARDLLDELTDPETGRVGYETVGTLSSRTVANQHYPPEWGEALTASGFVARLWIARLSGEARGEVLEDHAALIAKKPPEWDPEGLGCDMYYWYYASLASFHHGESSWEDWWPALEEAALPSQRRQGHAAGSWDPVGPWGLSGGRVYSTALMALCLETSRRYAPLRQR